MIKCFPELTPRAWHLAKLVQQPGTKDTWLFIGNEKQKNDCDSSRPAWPLQFDLSLGRTLQFIHLRIPYSAFLWCKKTQNWKSFQGKIRNIQVSILPFQILNNMVNKMSSFETCRVWSKTHTDLWIIKKKSNSGIWAKCTKLLFQINQKKKRLSNDFPITYILLLLESLWRFYFWKTLSWSFVSGKQLTWQLHKV